MRPPHLAILTALIVALCVIGGLVFVAADSGAPSVVVPQSDPAAVTDPAAVRSAPIAEAPDDATPEPTRTEVEPVPAGGGTLRGRLVDGDRAPLADTFAQFAFDDGIAWSAVRAVRTDANGRFVLDGVAADEPRQLAARVADMLGASVEVPALDAAADHDVGDLVLTGLPIIAHGIVVDDLGRPLAGARVGVESRRRVPVAMQQPGTARLPRSDAVDSADSAREIRIVSMDFVAATLEGSFRTNSLFDATIRSSDGDDSIELIVWSATELLATTTGADGRFVLRGPLPTDVFRVAATADAHRPGRSEDLAPGAAVTLTLPRVASIRGSARLPDWLPPDAVQFGFRAGGDGDLTTGTVEPDAQGVTFRIDDVTPGTGTLGVGLRGYPLPVLEIPDLRVDVDESRADPRAQDIDLTQRVHRFEMFARDAGGGLLTSLPSPLLVRTTLPDRAPTWSACAWTNGRTELFAPVDHVDAIALAPGYRRLELTLLPGSQDIRFEALHPVEVLLPDLRAAAGPDLRVRVSLVRKEGTGLPSGITATDSRTGTSKTFNRWELGYSGGAWLGDTDLVAVPLVMAGPYDVIARLRGNAEPSSETSITLGTIDVVLDGARPQRVVVPIDVGRIHAVAEEFRRDNSGGR